MKTPLAIFLLLIAASTFAQPVMPDINMRGGQDPWEEPAMKRTDVRKVIDVQFGNPYYSDLDTYSVITTVYDDQGFLATREQMRYAHEGDIEVPWLPEGLSKKAAATRTEYKFTNSGNLLHKKVYEVIPANSYLLLLDAINEWDDKGREDMHAGNNYRHTEKEKAIKAKELLAKGLPAIEELQQQEIYAYDAAGNVVSFSSTNRQVMKHYAYTYYPDGRVKTQNEISQQGGSSGTTTKEHHFTYTLGNKPATVTTVWLRDNSRDTIEQKRYTYNNAGTNDSLIIRQGAYTIYRVMSYQDTLLTGLTVIGFIPNTGKLDTVTHQAWTYEQGKLTRWTHMLHQQRDGNATVCEELFYNKEGLLIETRLYDKCADKKIRNQHLFFYGKPLDKETAKRKL